MERGVKGGVIGLRRPSIQFFAVLILFVGLRTRIDVQPKTFGVQVQFVPPTVVLENLGDVSGVVDLSKLDVALALLDRVSDKFR